MCLSESPIFCQPVQHNVSPAILSSSRSTATRAVAICRSYAFAKRREHGEAGTASRIAARETPFDRLTLLVVEDQVAFAGSSFAPDAPFAPRFRGQPFPPEVPGPLQRRKIRLPRRRKPRATSCLCSWMNCSVFDCCAGSPIPYDPFAWHTKPTLTPRGVMRNRWTTTWSDAFMGLHGRSSGKVLQNTAAALPEHPRALATHSR